jgi:hypothetical protein
MGGVGIALAGRAGVSLGRAKAAVAAHVAGPAGHTRGGQPLTRGEVSDSLLARGLKIPRLFGEGRVALHTA